MLRRGSGIEQGQFAAATRIALTDPPQVVVHAPRDLILTSTRGAVFGQAGASHSVRLGVSGCGGWELGDVTGRLAVIDQGSADIHAHNAGRAELAEKEHSESEVLADYLPKQLTQDEISAIVAQAIAATGAAELGMKGMGKVMAQVTPQTKGRADGSVVAAEVRRQLSS